MMRLAPHSMAGRAIAVAIPLVLIFAVITFVIHPIAAGFADRLEDIRRGSRLFQEFGARAVSADALHKELAALKSKVGSTAGYFAGSNPAIAGASLQSSVRKALANNGGALRSLQALPGAEEHGLQRIGVRIDASVPADRMVNLLYELETADPYLFTENLELRGSESSAASMKRSALLSVRADIYGYLRGP